jgi:hypothetical protein
VIALNDGRVMTWGGVDQAQPGNGYEFYDPATGQPSYGALSAVFTTGYSTAALLHDGTVLLVGGQDSFQSTGALSTTAIFSPSKEFAGCSNCDGWTRGPAMNVGHCEHTMTMLRSGLVLVAGGRCGASQSIAVAEIYEPMGKKWWPAATMHDARGFQTAALLPDGRVLVAGGLLIGGATTATTEIYTPA